MFILTTVQNMEGTPTGMLVAAIVALGGVVAFMAKTMWSLKMGDMASLTSRVTTLEEKLEGEMEKRQQAELRAERADIVAQAPCSKEDCPRRATFSLECIRKP